MPSNKLREYLESYNVHYTVIEHPPKYTAQESAASAHIPGDQLAKTVMIKIDGKLAMAVLPAPNRVNFDRLKEFTDAKRIELANEDEFKDMFPDCDLGAMPPFGNLYGMNVFTEQSLSEEIEITFCAGSHTELLRLSFTDFARLVKPKVLNFSWQR